MNGENRLTRNLLIFSACAFSLLFLALPLIAIAGQAFSDGIATYWRSLGSADNVHALLLTLLVAVITVPLNVLFGTAFAWLVTRFHFRGRAMLITLLDIPFAVSPVIAGLLYLILYGSGSWLGDYLEGHGLQVMFAWPGIVLVTLFVTSPFVARELIPFMQQHGAAEEEAAVTLGASPWQLWRKITLPTIIWPLIYGVALSNARAIGEFGGVSIVSGNIRGETQTLPLAVEALYQDYQTSAAFACASLLALIALSTLLLKAYIARKEPS